MLKQFLFPFIALFCALFFSCSGLINGDEGETVAEHESNYPRFDSEYYVYNWTTGTLTSSTDSVIYKFYASYGTTYKIFIRDYYSYYDYDNYADVAFSINDTSDFSGASYVSNVDDNSPSPYWWYNDFTEGYVYIKVEAGDSSSHASGNFEIAVVTGDLYEGHYYYDELYLEHVQ